MKVGLSLLSLLLAVLTLIRSDWIEVVFRVDPDHGNGLIEWFVLTVLILIALISAIAARLEWRRQAGSRT